MKELNKLVTAAVAVASLAVVDLTAIAVVNQFKQNSLIDNTTADYFITGLTIFGSFLGVIVLAIVGKIIFKLFKSAN